jgi:hypothetical protein
MIKLNPKRHLIGYHLSDPMKKRRKVLKKIDKKRKPLTIFRELNAKSTLTKNTQPTNSKKYKKDAKFIIS